MEFTRAFGNLGKGDTHLAGGKGASLGEMSGAGIPVPQGFVVLTTAFEQFVAETDLNAEIDTILNSVNHKKIHTVESAAEKIQALILDATMPEDIARVIKSEFKKLRSPFVAVRSSATAEDSSTAAWAGQLESFLNTTDTTLLQNVQKCWASLFTPRAIFYRFEKDLHKQKISVAVVVQKMIQSEVSGIAFSVHPVTQDFNQLIIEAGLGLGEAIVSGQITPDSYVIKKEPREIIDININVQDRALVKNTAGGNEWKNLPKSKAESQVLSSKKILELSKLIINIEQHYDFPVDIEWAMEKEKFYIVQSRPITTLSQVKVPRKVVYQKHQRDYTLLATSIVFEAYCNKKTRNYFSVDPQPMYISVENRVLYHFTAEEDSQARALSWVKKYPKTKTLQKHKQQHDAILRDYRRFLKENHSDPRNALQKLHTFFSDLLPLILVAIEVPEYAKKDIVEDIFNICLQIRKENEDVYKVGMDMERKLLQKIQTPTSALHTYLTAKEFRKFLTTGAVPPDLKQRAAFVIVRHGIEGERVVHNTKYLKNAGIAEETNNTQSKEIKGTTAYPGKVTGRVKIITLVDEASKIQEGEILVASMTDPRYVPILKKVKAVITDEGGITCHAAIVSRELKIPCIIGTKIATRILKDGDLVEVDAHKGIVKILSTYNTKNPPSFKKDKLARPGFELEFQREMPLAIYYLWYKGHIEAWRFLKQPTIMAKKVYAYYSWGMGQVYTQKSNIKLLKKSINKRPLQEIEKIITRYKKNSDILFKNPHVITDEHFMKKLIAGFVIMFVIGDITEHPLQRLAYDLRLKTESIFSFITEELKKYAKQKKEFSYYTYQELVKKSEVPNNVLLKRKKVKLEQGIIK